MAITVSAGPAVSGGLGSSTAFDLAGVDTGDSLVVGALWASATITITSVTCSGESNLTALTQKGPVGPDNTNAQLFYLSNVTSGGTKTITVNLTSSVGGSGVAFGMAFAGGDTSGFLDAEAPGGGSNGTGTSASTTVTTASANSLIVAIQNNNNGDATAGTGYTAISLSNLHWYIEGEYDLDAGAAGAKTVDMTPPASATWCIAAAAFKDAGGGGGGGDERRTLRLTLLGVG